MEQISIIERFPYPFQVSLHCTLFAGPLCPVAGPEGEDRTGGLGSNLASLPQCQVSLSCLETAWGSQMSFFEPRASSV